MLADPAKAKDDDEERPKKKRKQDDGGNSSSLLAALKCIQAFMRRKVITGPKDMMGVVLFNTVC